MSTPSRSFGTPADVVTTPTGQIAHAAHVEQSERLARRLFNPRPGVWCLVGNGLSNQTFVDAPDGIIAFDTGESIEETAAALEALREVTDRAIVAVCYTHFHYVAGTRAIGGDSVPVYGHVRITSNRARTGGEIAPTYSRGLVEQFGTSLPPDGPDGLVNVGLGRFFRDPAHAPFTTGHVEPTVTFAANCSLVVAGLQIDVLMAPSDADDSVTYWMPDLGVAVHNIVWPTLFNVFAIRGEEYRDPRVLLAGLDDVIALGAEHLVGTHGPPLSGSAQITQRVTRARDAIQFLWDQTVRQANRGLLSADIGQAVRLPSHCDDDYLTSELYGVAEHHARQIRSGLFGFFDGDLTELFPLPSAERADRLIEGFGGRERVRAQATAARDAHDLRWALELAGWLTQSSGCDGVDRGLAASVLRAIGQRSSAANIRNWCLTRARMFDGTTDRSRLTRHRLTARQILAAADHGVGLLRVMLDPDRADGIDVHLRWCFDDDVATGLHVRNSVACPTDGTGASATLECSPSAWAAVVAGGASLSDAIADGSIRIVGETTAARRALACFDPESLGR